MSKKVEQLTDVQLVQLYRDGDTNVFDEIYERHYKRIFQFIANLTCSTTEAQDITQYCFVTLLENIDKIDDQKKSLDFYLLKMARNKVYKDSRDRQKEASWSVVIPEEHFSTSNPIEELLLKELSEEVKMVLSNLSFKYREVLLLHDYENLRPAEVVQILGESIDAVKSRLYRARASFISLISPYINTKSNSIEVERV